MHLQMRHYTQAALRPIVRTPKGCVETKTMSKQLILYKLFINKVPPLIYII